MIFTFILGVIPARGGSKGIPRKNLYSLAGRPLIQYTLDAAFKSKLSDFIISTDDRDIAACYEGHVMRPKELANDDTPMLPVVQHAVKAYEKRFKNAVDAVMVLQPTSPLRLAEDIDKSIEKFVNSGADSLVSVYGGIHPVKSYDENGKPFLEQVPYDKHRHKCWTRNGAIFIARRNLLDSGRLIGYSPAFYVMPKSRSVDVDDYEDLLVCECLLSCKGDA